MLLAWILSRAYLIAQVESFDRIIKTENLLIIIESNLVIFEW